VNPSYRRGTFLESPVRGAVIIHALCRYHISLFKSAVCIVVTGRWARNDLRKDLHSC
jgi:hypothetical protein